MLDPGRWAGRSPRCDGRQAFAHSKLTAGIVSEILFTTKPPVQGAPTGHPRACRRALRALSSVLIVLGVLALLDVGVTLVWQEPFSALYAKLQQDHLRGTLRTLEHAKPTASESARLLAARGRAPAHRLPGE